MANRMIRPSFDGVRPMFELTIASLDHVEIRNVVGGDDEHPGFGHTEKLAKLLQPHLDAIRLGGESFEQTRNWLGRYGWSRTH